MGRKPAILLSFDVEEFDLPLEYGQSISIDEQLQVGLDGLKALTPLLNQPLLHTTLFSTAFFAETFPDSVRSLAGQHEIASHTYYHTRFEDHDLANSKRKLEEISGQAVTGLRMPRMKMVSPDAVTAAGYQYNSSINPTWLPGRYNNLDCPRKPFLQKDLLQVPTSVTPLLRIPLFWLAFKNMPYSFYRHLVLRTLKYDGYVLLYFHPWEFVNLSAYALPRYVKRKSGPALLAQLERLIRDLSNEGEFRTMQDFLQEKNPASVL